MTVLQACEWLHRNNRGVDYSYNESTKTFKIISKIPPEEWKEIPEGWYYSENYGFTNRHRTTNTSYDAVEVIFKPSILKRLFH